MCKPFAEFSDRPPRECDASRKILPHHCPQFLRPQHLALAAPGEDPAFHLAEVGKLHPQEQAAVGLGFAGLRLVPDLLAGPAGGGGRETQDDLVPPAAARARKLAPR